jgi:hypothetical protein
MNKIDIEGGRGENFGSRNRKRTKPSGKWVSNISAFHIFKTLNAGSVQSDLWRG